MIPTDCSVLRIPTIIPNIRILVWLRPTSCEHVPLGYIGVCNKSILPLTCPKGLASRRSMTWEMAFCTGIMDSEWVKV